MKMHPQHICRSLAVEYGEAEERGMEGWRGVGVCDIKKGKKLNSAAITTSNQKGFDPSDMRPSASSTKTASKNWHKKKQTNSKLKY